jgi:hypothetical protein
MTDHLKGQRQLLVIWSAGCAVVAVLLAAQSLFGKYGDAPGPAWAWFLPLVAPPLALVWTAYVHDRRREHPADSVDSFALGMSKWLSIGYLFALLALLLVQPVTNWTPLKLVDMSRLFLGPAQAVLTWYLGAFFVSQKSES